MNIFQSVVVGTLTLASLTAWQSPAESATDPAPSTRAARPSEKAVKAEIRRIVKDARRVARDDRSERRGDSSTEERVDQAIECAEFLESQRYCLIYGWTSSTEQAVEDDLASQAISARTEASESTGDMSLSAILEEIAQQTPDERAASVRQELVEAANGIDTVLKLEQANIEPETPPEDSSRLSGRTRLSGIDYPESGGILKDRVTEQTEKNWCGPTTLQMMAWNWGDHEKVAQSTWASRLGTTSDGSSITNMVEVINNNAQLSKWVTKQDAAYTVVNIANFSYAKWYELNVNHYSTWGTPVVLHPELLKKYYPYLDDDGEGHFQLGRGWDFQSNQSDAWQVKYYEPWNQQRFDPSEPFIPRMQTRWAKNSYLANQKHFLHNIGV